MTRLPAEGRKGPPPAWPLMPDLDSAAAAHMAAMAVEDAAGDLENAPPRGRKKAQADLRTAQHRLAVAEARVAAIQALELTRWADVWARPQAVAWERLGYLGEVAQYVRWKTRAELGDLRASTEARQLADRLGLTPLAMLRLRWEVAADELGAARGTRTGSARKKAAPRLRAVDRAAAAGR